MSNVRIISLSPSSLCPSPPPLSLSHTHTHTHKQTNKPALPPNHFSTDANSFIDPEDGRSTFLRNVGTFILRGLKTEKKTNLLYCRRPITIGSDKFFFSLYDLHSGTGFVEAVCVGLMRSERETYLHPLSKLRRRGAAVHRSIRLH